MMMMITNSFFLGHAPENHHHLLLHHSTTEQNVVVKLLLLLVHDANDQRTSRHQQHLVETNDNQDQRQHHLRPDHRHQDAGNNPPLYFVSYHFYFYCYRQLSILSVLFVHLHVRCLVNSLFYDFCNVYHEVILGVLFCDDFCATKRINK